MNQSPAGDVNLASDGNRSGRAVLILASVLAINVAVLILGPPCVDQAGIFPSTGLLFNIVNIPPYWMFGAVTFISFWTVFGSGRWYVRSALGLLGWLWLDMALLFGEMLDPNPDYGLFETWLVMAGILALASSSVFALQRRFFALRPCAVGTTIRDLGQKRFHYNVSHLIIVTSLVAVTLAFARLINIRNLHLFAGWGTIHFVSLHLRQAAVDAIMPLLLALITIELAKGTWQNLLWIALVIPLLTAIDIPVHALFWTAPQWPLFWNWFPRVYGEWLLYYTAGNLSLVLSIVLMVAALKRIGYRLGRTAVRRR